MKREKISTLNYLRIISALIVFLFHIYLRYETELNLKYINTVTRVGAVFMVAFFMLSGFTLFYNYNHIDFLKKNNLKNYYLKRIVSIYPLYFVSLIIIWLLDFDMPEKISQTILIIPMQLLGLQSFFPNVYFNFGNSNSWFISTIFVLYFIYPFLQILFQKIFMSKKILLMLCVFLSIYFYFVAMYFGTGTGFYYYYPSPIFRIPEFIIGMILAWAVVSDKKYIFKYNGLWIFLTIIFFVVGINILYIWFDTYEKYNLFNVVCIPSFAFIIYLLATSKNKFIIWSSNTKIISYLSEITFPFYVSQLIAIIVIKKIETYNIYSFRNGAEIIILCFLLNFLMAIILNETIVKVFKKIILKINNKEYNSI